MSTEKKAVYDAVILLAKGYDEGFVSVCVGKLREAGIRTHLVGLKSQYVTSWHGIEMQADSLLRNWRFSESTRLVVVPGRSECVAALAREPMVSELVRDVLRQDGSIAAAYSAETLLAEHQQTLPADMSILPKEIDADHYLPQGLEEDHTFIRSIIKHIR